MNGTSDEHPDDAVESSKMIDMTDSIRSAMSLDGDISKLISFYDEWAADYDRDVANHGYGPPTSTRATSQR